MSELVYLQCGIKLLCVKKETLLKIPYFSGLLNFNEQQNSLNTPLIVDYDYKALKSVLNYAKDEENYSMEYLKDYDYFNIDTKPIIEYDFKIKDKIFKEYINYYDCKLLSDCNKLSLNKNSTVLTVRIVIHDHFINYENIEVKLRNNSCDDVVCLSLDFFLNIQNGKNIIVNKEREYTEILFSYFSDHNIYLHTNVTNNKLIAVGKTSEQFDALKIYNVYYRYSDSLIFNKIDIERSNSIFLVSKTDSVSIYYKNKKCYNGCILKIKHNNKYDDESRIYCTCPPDIIKDRIKNNWFSCSGTYYYNVTNYMKNWCNNHITHVYIDPKIFHVIIV